MKIREKYVYPQNPPAPPDGYEIVEVSHVTESSGPNPGWQFEDEVRWFAEKRHSSLEAYAEPSSEDWDGNPLDTKMSQWDKIQGKWSDWESI